MTASMPKLLKTIDCTEKSHDIQGIVWDGVTRRRDLVRNIVDGQTFNVFNELTVKPTYKPTSTEVDGLVRPIDYIQVPSIENFHMQLHDNFRAVSLHDYVFPTESCLMHFNRQTLVIKPLLDKKSITCMDVYRNYILVGHEPNSVSLVDLESSKLLKTIKFGEDHQLINSIKFVDDRSGGLKVLVGGNNNAVELFDLEQSSSPISRVPVDFFVNHIAISKDYRQASFSYDAKHVDIIDLRTFEVTATLHGHTDYTFAADYDSDGTQLATGNQDLTTRIWDIRKMQQINMLPCRNSASSYLKYMDSSRLLIVGESVSYISFYRTDVDYSLVSTIDYFGELVGIDVKHDQVIAGIGKKFNDVTSGILRMKVGGK
jgi:WD40 repeat protein